MAEASLRRNHLNQDLKEGSLENIGRETISILEGIESAKTEQDGSHAQCVGEKKSSAWLEPSK